ncbi:MAG: hypothetical protein OXM88_15315, partial [bacterium]|nr:hypothetical protein [bacterium]
MKRVKRAAFGFNFANYRIRALLYAGKPNWDLLATVTPHCNPMSQLTEIRGRDTRSHRARGGPCLSLTGCSP